jgi:hypothetical protein
MADTGRDPWFDSLLAGLSSLGSGGDWLDRNFGGGVYGAPDISGRAIAGLRAISSLAPIAGELSDGAEALSGIGPNGETLAGWERGVSVLATITPIVPAPLARKAVGAAGTIVDDVVSAGKAAIGHGGSARHYADWNLFGPRGGLLKNGDAASGLDFELPQGWKLSFPEQSWYGHTEGKLISDLLEEGLLKPGRYLSIEGTLPPCRSCQDLMKMISEKFQMMITYEDGVGKVWRWKDGVSNGG